MILRFLILSLCLTVNAATWYASPTGLDEGAGTLASPLSLKAAIGDGFTSPCSGGDTLYLRGGTYTGEFHSYLATTIGSHITVASYTNEWAVLDSGATNLIPLTLYGSNTWYRGFEVMNSGTPREIRVSGIWFESPGSKIINCVIHDSGQGIYVALPTSDYAGAEIYGNVIYNYGDDDLTTGMKHGVYAHSRNSGLLIKDNIVLNGFYIGVHVYGEGVNQMDNCSVIGNTCFECGSLHGGGERHNNFLYGGTEPADDATFVWNMGYFSTSTANNFDIGYTPAENGTATVRSNFMAGGTFYVQKWANLAFDHNTFWDASTYMYYLSPGTPGTITWDNNAYGSSFGTPFRLDGTLKSWAAWKSDSGFDASSTLTTDPMSVGQVFVRTNDYQSGRANITIYNPASADNVTVTVSSFLPSGARYRVRDSQRYLVPLLTNTVSGTTISLPMTNLVCAVPVDATTPSSAGPAFGAFVVEQIPALAITGTITRNVVARNLRINAATP